MRPWAAMDQEDRLAAIHAAIVAGAGSAAEIAEMVGTGRNSVIGMCHRHGIALPGSRIYGGKKGGAKSVAVSRPVVKLNKTRRGKKKVGQKAPRPAAPIPEASSVVTEPVIVAPEPAVAVSGVELLDRRRDQCSWPLWHPGDDHRRVCGRPVAGGAGFAGRLWCADHVAAGTSKTNRKDAQPVKPFVLSKPQPSPRLPKRGDKKPVATQDLDRLSAIIGEVAAKAGISTDTLVSRTRRPAVTATLHQVMYRAMAETGLPIDAIGAALGGRTGESVVHGVKVHAERAGLPVPRG